jgi:ADP-dependent NAD(P)H-hydrate dehydratase
MMAPGSTIPFVQTVLPLFKDAVVLLDALAMDVAKLIRRFEQRVILTPHAGEMAHLTGGDKQDLQADPQGCACRQAQAWHAVVALKGATSCIAAPDGRCWTHRAQAPGLGTSGSGDVLAGLIAGLAARGCPPEQAAVWGVALHARAGAALVRRNGTLGLLARELAAEVPALMHGLAPVG